MPRLPSTELLVVASNIRPFSTAVPIVRYRLEQPVILNFRNVAAAGVVTPSTLSNGAVPGVSPQPGVTVSVAPEQPGRTVPSLSVALPWKDKVTVLPVARWVRLTSGLPGMAALLLTVRHRVVTCVLRTLPLSGRTSVDAFPLALREIATVMPDELRRPAPLSAACRVLCMPRAHRQPG